MSQASKLALIKEMIDSAESNLRSAKQMLLELIGGKTSKKNVYAKIAEELDPIENGEEEEGEKNEMGSFDYASG